MNELQSPRLNKSEAVHDMPRFLGVEGVYKYKYFEVYSTVQNRCTVIRHTSHVGPI